MADSDTEGPEEGFDPSALLQMDMVDAGSETTDSNLEMIGAPEVDLQEDSDTGNTSDQQTPTKHDGIKLKSFEDEKQYISLMELANLVQREEMDARSKFYNLQLSKNCRHFISRAYSHCTICDAHVPIIVNKPQVFVGHPILKTLVCNKCYNFYGDGNFDRGEDGIDLYCRWCAEGGTLFCCSSCPNVFCKKCVKLNFGQHEVKKVNDATSWSCYVCESKLLWGYRGLYATIAQILADYKSVGEDVLSQEDRNKDLAACCTYRQDLKQYMKTQYKVMITYCPGVLIPQLKIKVAPPPPLKRLSLTSSYSVNVSEEEEAGGEVNDFFANGHFLESALAPPPPPQKPPVYIAPKPRIPPIAPQPQHASNTFLLVRTQGPRTPQLIRPRNLSMLQGATFTRGSPPALVRRSTPPMLSQSSVTRASIAQPRFSGRGRNISPQIRFRSPRTNPSPSFAPRAPNNVSISSPIPSRATSIASKPVSIEVPTPEWFCSILDQALMSADFYKDEIVKLKLNSMAYLQRKDVDMSRDSHIFNTVRSLNWITKSMLEQGLDIRRAVSKSYPGVESARETLNMEKLFYLKGVPFYKNQPKIGIPPQTSNRIITGRNQMKNTNSAVTPYRPVNGIKKSNDVVDLVSDEEDNTNGDQSSVSKKHSLTISPVQSINNRISLQNQHRIPLTPTPSNRLSAPGTQSTQFNKQSPSTRKRRKKKACSDDSEDDEDYIPKSDPSVMKRRRRSNVSLLNNKSPTTSTPQLMVTNIRSLQSPSTESGTIKSSTNLSYLNQVSEDVMEKVLQLDSGNDSSDVDEHDAKSPRDPLEEDDRDDWIAQNPTAYEKYCIQYNLVKDWYIAVKTMSPSITNR